MSSSEKQKLITDAPGTNQYDDDLTDVEKTAIRKRASFAIRNELTRAAPEDKYNLAYYIFYLQGFGCLVPWNSFITVLNYWSYKMEGSKFANNYLPFFTTSFQVVNLSMMLLATGAMSRMKVTTRIGVPYVLQFLLFVVILAMVKMDIRGDEFFFITLGLVCGSAWTQAFYQGGLFGLAGMMPPKYMQSIMGGQALGGVMVSVLNIITQASIKSADDSGFIFFAISVGVLFVCVLSFWWLLQMPIVKHYTKPRKSATDDVSSINNSCVKQDTKPSPIVVLKEVWPFASSVCLTFAVTLAVFPSIAATVVSMEDHKSVYASQLFIPIYCFLGFNVGDLLGRTIAGRVQWPPANKPRTLQLCTVLRIAFIPLFMMCNVHTGLSDDNSLPRLFKTDAMPYILMLLLGTSNGYFGTLCMMFGPQSVDPNKEETAGFVLLVSMISGIAIGSFLGFAILAVLCECNSFLGPEGNSSAINGTNTSLYLY